MDSAAASSPHNAKYIFLFQKLISYFFIKDPVAAYVFLLAFCILPPFLQQRVNNPLICNISGFRQEAAQNCPLLDHYAAISGNFLPTFRDNLSIPSSWFNNPKAILNSIHEP
jgi:hypothetical protein